MANTLTIIKQRFVKGLRQAPYEFVAPLVVAARGGRALASKISKHLDEAMVEARAKADRPGAHK